jgi:hypothetical protein
MIKVAKSVAVVDRFVTWKYVAFDISKISRG